MSTLVMTLYYLCLPGVPEGDPNTYPIYELIYDFKPSNTE